MGIMLFIDFSLNKSRPYRYCKSLELVVGIKMVFNISAELSSNFLS